MFKNVLLFCLFAVLICACNSEGSNSAKNKSQAQLLSPEQYKQKMDATNNKVVVDLRSHGELHQIGPIIGARNFDYNSGKLQELIKNLNKDTSYFLYCASGNRSSKASKELIEAGSIKVYDLEGGINAWKNAGYPIARHSH